MKSNKLENEDVLCSMVWKRYGVILSQSPTMSELYRNRAWYAMLNKDIDEALKCINRAIKVDPLFIHAYSDKAFFLHKQGREKEVDEVLRKMCKIRQSIIDR